jgi:hypothetical protein
MSSFSNYYFLVAVLFLICAVSDLIFSGSVSLCPFTGSATSIFVLMGILNIFITALLLLVGVILNFFDGLDPDELLDLGWLKKIMGILVRLLPTLVTILHTIKVILVLVGVLFAFINNQISTEYLNDLNFNSTSVFNICLYSNETEIQKIITGYPQKIMIFESIELFSVFFSLFVLGMIKNIIAIDGYFYEPENLSHGGCRKLCFRKLGP